MILRLSSAAARFTVVLVGFVLATVLSYSSIRNAMAAHYAGVDTRSGYERAVQWEPGNAEAWHLLGRSWQYDLESADVQRAITAHRRSLSRNPRSPTSWLDLPTAPDSKGDLPAARDA